MMKEGSNPKAQKFLVISSRPLGHSAGLATDVVNALRQSGHEVDFLTHYGPRFRKVNFKFLEYKPIKLLILEKLIQLEKTKLGKFLRDQYRKIKKSKPIYIENNGIKLTCFNEDKISFNTKRLDPLSAKNDYDAIITVFWQDMLNSSSLKLIYDRLKVPILVFSPDMIPLTGGCYYFGSCRNFEHGCGSCPGLCSNDPIDQTSKNYALKQKNFNEMPIVFCGNSWMLEFAKKSHTFHNDMLANLPIVLNELDFAPSTLKRDELMDNLGLDKCYKNVVLARSQNVGRKGLKYIFQAFKATVENRRKRGIDDTILLTVGDKALLQKCKENNLPCCHLGYVNKQKLIMCYQISTCFINASLDDAGPSMINQSILCGTPVVCFDNGTAVDVIHNDISGYKVPTGDGNGLAQKLIDLLDMSSTQLAQMKKTTREEALAKHSYQSFVDKITEILIILKRNEIVQK